MSVCKSGEVAVLSGIYAEVGHGGGRVKGGRRVEVKQGEKLPELDPYTVTVEYKGEKKSRRRQRGWQLVKRK
ncbi:YjzC family protein [Bacillus massiliglaciei]|uniref:YjzC family protein n=1 Tax=Bacillus massiliglaciei TaxID=1816693 RepID=UPI000DA613AB|nr:YjzC family protein [Bacillus massiliglaciei]